MSSYDVGPSDLDSPTAVWACRSWFCKQRGPFWVRNLHDAKLGARAHAERKFLGIWSHQPMACALHDKRASEILRTLRS